MVSMTDDQIDGFLSSQNVGVLGLPAENAPSMRPLSFWFDGESTIYFLYVLGPDSRKARLSERADAARFLAYRAETPFNWRSVLLTGSIEAVSEDERTAVEETMEMRGRPDVFERASTVENTELYQFLIDERTGIEHLGLPPGLERD